MTPTTAVRSEAARRANETRRARLDAELLRGAWDGPKRAVVTEHVIPFLLEHTSPAGIVGDLLGGAGSAAEMTAAGLRVLSVDDLDFAVTKLHIPRPRAERAAQMLAESAGVVEFVRGQFIDYLDRMETAFYDGCGNLYAGSPTARVIQAAGRRGMPAIAVTIELSQVEGTKQAFPDGAKREHYLTLAEVVVRRVSNYRLVDAIPYMGRAGVIPMAVLLLCQVKRFGGGGCYSCKKRYHRLWSRARTAAKRQERVVVCCECGLDISAAAKANTKRCRPCQVEAERSKKRAYQAERRADLRSDPIAFAEHRASLNASRRERYRTDPDFRAKCIAEASRRYWALREMERAA